MEKTNHSEHDSSKMPVEGCPLCDAEIGRPIKRRFGLGASETVIPMIKQTASDKAVMQEVLEEGRKN